VPNPTPDELLLRAAIDGRANATRAKDVEGVLTKYASEVVAFDVVTPLQNTGAAALRQRLIAWFASFKSPLEYDFVELSLAVAGDVAFDHHLTKVHAVNQSGQTIDMWFRETVCYRKIDGQWKVTHQHSSVPIDMEDGKGRMDLKPLGS
jgi:ketosteroid isomerase-like protein